MAGENGHMERPASPQELEEALDRIYTGTRPTWPYKLRTRDNPGTSKATIPGVRRRPAHRHQR